MAELGCRVTLDTNIFPANDLIREAQGLGFEFNVVSVTDRELENRIHKANLPTILETAVFGESRWGHCVFAGGDTEDRLEFILRLLSNGGFPKKGDRASLTSGQRDLFRDTLILEAHIRERREIFVTDDLKAFHGPKGDRQKIRQSLHEKFATRIMTASEFLDYCRTERTDQERNDASPKEK